MVETLPIDDEETMCCGVLVSPSGIYVGGGGIRVWKGAGGEGDVEMYIGKHLLEGSTTAEGVPEEIKGQQTKHTLKPDPKPDPEPAPKPAPAPAPLPASSGFSFGVGPTPAASTFGSGNSKISFSFGGAATAATSTAFGSTFSTPAPAAGTTKGGIPTKPLFGGAGLGTNKTTEQQGIKTKPLFGDAKAETTEQAGKKSTQASKPIVASSAYPPMSKAAPKNPFSTKASAPSPAPKTAPSASSAYPPMSKAAPKNPFSTKASAPSPAPKTATSASSAYPPMSKAAPKNPFSTKASAPAPAPKTATSASSAYPPMSKDAPSNPFSTKASAPAPAPAALTTFGFGAGNTTASFSTFGGFGSLKPTSSTVTGGPANAEGETKESGIPTKPLFGAGFGNKASPAGKAASGGGGI
ncbi:hypothetical protein TrRE_jg13402, partial [Triparma retinervis]